MSLVSHLTQEYVRSLFDYKAGDLYWKVRRQGRKIGVPAGCGDGYDYRVIRIDGKGYLTHRLIFLYHHGYLPNSLDHIDGNKLNNSIDNLREATQQQNQWNSKKPKSYIGKPTTSEYKGVHWDKYAKKWVAYITIDKKRKHIGLFDSEIDAAKAYDKAAIEAFGKFARPNGVMK